MVKENVSLCLATFQLRTNYFWGREAERHPFHVGGKGVSELTRSRTAHQYLDLNLLAWTIILKLCWETQWFKSRILTFWAAGWEMEFNYKARANVPQAARHVYYCTVCPSSTHPPSFTAIADMAKLYGHQHFEAHQTVICISHNSNILDENIFLEATHQNI